MKQQMHKCRERLKTILDDCLSTPRDGGKPALDISGFYNKWFTGSFFFQFRKSLRVTNISHAELLSLVHTYTTLPGCQRTPHHFQFMSSHECRHAIADVVVDIASSDRHQMIDDLTDLYAGLLNQIIVVDSYYTSCVVSLPDYMTIDLAAICGKAGYVFACGKKIYIRSISKATGNQFETALERHLRSNPPPRGTRIPFIVFSHEDFTEYDRHHANDMRNGLDEVKVFVEKHYLGSESLVSVLRSIKTRYEGLLFFPKPGDFTKAQRALMVEGVCHDRCIWVIMDRMPSEGDIRHPSDETLLICYEQEYANANPCMLFEENKPAWIAQTTLPHSLAAAMINITKPYWPSDAKVVDVLDPFCGSGTVYFEARKYERARVRARDINPIVPLMVRDNIAVLSSTPTQIQEWRKGAECALDNKKRIEEINELARRVDDLSREDAANGGGSGTLLGTIESLGFEERLLFYLAIRTNKRHGLAQARESTDWHTAFRYEYACLDQQLDHLCVLKNFEVIKEEPNRCMARIRGKYSTAVTTATKAAYGVRGEEACENNEGGDKRYVVQGGEVGCESVEEVEGGRYDLIITDPPYGLNTPSKKDELARLYQGFATTFVRALKREGQIVLCLPEDTKTGQIVPSFARREFVVSQFLVAVNDEMREIINPGQIVPRLNALYRPPFYWESDRALRRTILHFRIRKLEKHCRARKRGVEGRK